MAGVAIEIRAAKSGAGGQLEHDPEKWKPVFG